MWHFHWIHASIASVFSFSLNCFTFSHIFTSVGREFQKLIILLEKKFFLSSVFDFCVLRLYLQEDKQVNLLFWSTRWNHVWPLVYTVHWATRLEKCKHLGLVLNMFPLEMCQTFKIFFFLSNDKFEPASQDLVKES